MSFEEAAKQVHEVEPAVEESEKKPKDFWQPLTILGLVILAVWVASLFIPAGVYDMDEVGSPVPGSFHFVEAPLSGGEHLVNLVLSPVNGLYGIQGEDGQVRPFGSGRLFGSAQVFLFILAIGAFMTVVFATGALDLGIAHLAHRFKDQGAILIIVLSILFGVLGSVMSWSDETLGFYALLVPVVLALGYDRMVAVAVITVAPFVGVIGSTVNPFRIGVGSDAAGVSIGDGLPLRVVMFVLTMAAMIIYTLWYAKRVKRDASTSIVGIDEADAEYAAEASDTKLDPLTGRHKLIIGLVGFTFAMLIFSIVPWSAIFNPTTYDPVTLEQIPNVFGWELGWWLPELTALFLVMAVVVGMVGRLGESGIAKNMLKGAVDFTGPAVLVFVARAVSVILTNTQTLDTVLNTMEGFVSGTSNIVFIILMTIVSLPLGFLIGSGSAGMALVMPILGPLGDFAGIDRSLVVTIYNSVGGWLLLFVPTNALLMAGLALGRVGFGKYLKFMMPLLGILGAIIIVVQVAGALF